MRYYIQYEFCLKYKKIFKLLVIEELQRADIGTCLLLGLGAWASHCF